MTRTKSYLATALAFSAASIASAGMAKEQAAAPAPVVLASPPAGMSQVVFYRPSAMGMAISCNIRENGKMVGTTNNGRYFVLVTTPGLHKFTTKSEATDEINIEAEADETSYIKCKIGMGFMAGRPNLSPSTKEDFDTRSAKLKLSDSEKMARTIAEDDAKHATTK